jgi:ribonuclease VapC
MVVDTSALLAVLLEEPDGALFLARLSSTPRLLLSAANWLELGIVIDGRKGPQWLADLDAFLEGLDIAVVPVSLSQARIALDAYRRYGKGNHPASLNFGDCFAYALARDRDLPLLFKGEDFSQTDLRPAM